MSVLEEGHLVGRYRVEAFLAEGGMGRIYRALDTALGRRVALKVIAGDHAPGSPAVARLLREARAAAALSHPNICSVFDVGESDGRPFIAMELVQGTSLRALIPRRDVGLDQRLRWVCDLAAALAAAHRAHLVHRDIKPDNVMVAADGRVRLLDFGVVAWAGGDSEAAASPGAAHAFRTQDGAIVGTVGYMAPEQAAGGAIDARTDQFAWGVVAYETLSARHPFGGGDRFDEPALLSDAVPKLPFGVAAIVAKAMALEPRGRFADMDEIAGQLAPVVGAAPPLPLQSMLALPSPARPRATSDAAIDAATGAATGAATDAATDAARDAAIDAATGAAIGTTGDARSTVPDRSALAVATTQAMPPRRAARRIWLGAVVGGAALILAAGAVRALRRPPRRDDGGAALAVSHVRRVTFGDGCEEFPSFTPDGRAVVYDGTDATGTTALYRLDLADGAVPRKLLSDGPHGRANNASVSPAGDRIVFVRATTTGSEVALAALDGSAARRFSDRAMFPRWSSDGRAVWARRRGVVGLYDAASDAASTAAQRTLHVPQGLQLIWVLGGASGPAIAQASGARGATPSELVAFGGDGQVAWRIHADLEPALALAPGGRHVLASRQRLGSDPELIAVPLDNGPVISLAGVGVAARDGFDVSADGRTIAWSSCHSMVHAAAVDPEGRERAMLPREGDEAIAVAGIPGSGDLLVVSGRTGKPALWRMDPGDQRAPQPIALGDRAPREVAVSPDGAWFAVSVPAAGIAVGSLRGDAAVRMVTDRAGDASPSFRKAGDAISFTRPGSDGRGQVMVVPVDGGEPVALLGPGTHDAAASPADDMIAYVSAAPGVPMRADARGRDPRPLSPALEPGSYRELRFSPDGARVLVQRGDRELIELDAATGAILGMLSGSPAEYVYAPTYVSIDGVAMPAAVRVSWQGSIYVADAVFGAALR